MHAYRSGLKTSKLEAPENPKLKKTDIMRLRTLIRTSTIYQKRFAEYVGYRQIERKVNQAIEWLKEHQNDREKISKLE